MAGSSSTTERTASMHVGSPPPPLAGPSQAQARAHSLPEKLRAAFLPAEALPGIETAPLTPEDRRYVCGETRQTAQRLPAYFDRLALAEQEIRRWHSPHPAFRPISPSEANTSFKSWQTVLCGLRPAGQFSVRTLFSPQLHAILALDNIGALVFRKEQPNDLFIVVVYRQDAPDGEMRARRFVDLCRVKQEISRSIPGDAIARAIGSEQRVAREMGEVLNYDQASIDDYMHRLRWPQTGDPRHILQLSRGSVPFHLQPDYKPAE